MLEKAALRREAEARRSQLVRPDFAARLAGYAGALELALGAVVAGYRAFRYEADPVMLFSALAGQGHPLALPVITGRAQPLRFHRWTEADLLIRHAYGVEEPHPGAEVVLPDVLLVPLLAFDATGYRLGYGGGFYDRTLAELRGRKTVSAIGIAYAGQEVDVLPHDSYDQRLDAILTEDGLRRF